jgi:flagellar basal body rod protein FlgG
LNNNVRQALIGVQTGKHQNYTDAIIDNLSNSDKDGYSDAAEKFKQYLENNPAEAEKLNAKYSKSSGQIMLQNNLQKAFKSAGLL